MALVWNATVYAPNHQMQQAQSDQFFFQHYRFRGDEVVLDVGSGDGKTTARIAQAVPKGQVIGWDLSLSMITYAREQYPFIRFEHKDASLPASYEENGQQFNLVVSFHTLHWIADQEAVLRGIAYALKSGGKAYFFIASNGFDPLQVIADELMKTPPWREIFTNFHDPLHRFSEEQYKYLLQQAGLIPYQVKEVVEKHPLQSKEDLKKQIVSWMPHLKFLSDPYLREAFLSEMVDLYMERFFPGLDQPSYLIDCNLEVIALKV